MRCKLGWKNITIQNKYFCIISQKLSILGYEQVSDMQRKLRGWAFVTDPLLCSIFYFANTRTENRNRNLHFFFVTAAHKKFGP